MMVTYQDIDNIRSSTGISIHNTWCILSSTIVCILVISLHTEQCPLCCGFCSSVFFPFLFLPVMLLFLCHDSALARFYIFPTRHYGKWTLHLVRRFGLACVERTVIAQMRCAGSPTWALQKHAIATNAHRVVRVREGVMATIRTKQHLYKCITNGCPKALFGSIIMLLYGWNN